MNSKNMVMVIAALTAIGSCTGLATLTLVALPEPARFVFAAESALLPVIASFQEPSGPIDPALEQGSGRAENLQQASRATHLIFLPSVMKNADSSSALLVQPAELVYRGVFRLPDDGLRPRTFEYGGNAMTFNPEGDSSGMSDGFPGSLFITGHDRMAVDLPDGSQVAEIDIPIPVNSKDLTQLNQASFLQGFANVSAGQFTTLDEIPRIGMSYLNIALSGAKIHLAWGRHMPPDPVVPTHAWFDPILSTPNFRGTWFIGSQSFESVNGYLFNIPPAWADARGATSGRYLATGRFRDGGWSGMEPALFAYRPWQADGSPPVSGIHLPEATLLLYENSQNTSNIERCLNGYQHPDEWEGGAWLTTGAGKAAVLFVGTKSTGAKYWYGWVNPAGSQYPCVETEMIGDFTVCYLANGLPCPPEDLAGCTGHNDYRGWWGVRSDAQFIFYNPGDLAQVAAGTMNSWQPQPYATLDIDERLLLNPGGVEQDMIGTGDQRRYRIGDVAYDRSNGHIYVLELFADGAKPVVHVWKLN